MIMNIKQRAIKIEPRIKLNDMYNPVMQFAPLLDITIQNCGHFFYKKIITFPLDIDAQRF